MKEVIEQNEVIYLKIEEIETMLREVISYIKPPAIEEGDWKDCIEWLRQIPGGPKPNIQRSLNNLCGRGKLFRPGHEYNLINGRRVFIRPKVEEAVRKSISNGN